VWVGEQISHWTPPVAENRCRPVQVNPALACLSASRSVLLLQGPVGPFFDRIAAWLDAGGARVHRVVFQGGDTFDCRAAAAIPFRGSPHQWDFFLRQQLHALGVDCIVLFGQARLYHETALEVAAAAGIPVVVMEEGYFRPGFVTMELGGVNGYSTTLQRYVWEPPARAELYAGDAASSGVQPDVVPWHFQKMAWHASQHYLALRRDAAAFPHYVHHRIDDPDFYAAYWLRSWGRKLRRRGADRQLQARLFREQRPYFFVPLQHDGDSQLTHHSRFQTNGIFATEVLQSFAAHAPRDALLVFRQHPHARGGPGHFGLIDTMTRELGIEHRVRYMVEGDTPDLVGRAQGVIVINSTVGLQALERGSPLMVMGDSMYKHPQLTHSGPLDTFWTGSRPPDAQQAEGFLLQIKNLTQAPASVYAGRSVPLAWRRKGL
jgi:capsular polysaccharide export protein